MNIMLIFGLIIGFAAVFIGVPEIRNSYQIYLDPDSFILVAGGVLAATMISTSFGDFINLIKLLSGWAYFRHKKMPNYKMIQSMVEISEEAHQRGKANVLDFAKQYKDSFLNRAMALVVAGLDKDFVRLSLETDILQKKNRHRKMLSIIRAMGSFAPMFGMMGTVIGVMQVLRNVEDIQSIVAGMSLALMTTLYGIIFASLLFIPLTNRFKFISDDDALGREIITEGAILILEGQIPLKVEKLLMAFVSLDIRRKAEKRLQR